MRLKLHETTYLSRRITRDLITCDFIEARKDKASIEEQVERILDEDILKEQSLDEKVEEILDSQTEEIEYLNADRRQLFWMTKKRLANDFGVILNKEDRFSDKAHKTLEYLWEEDFIHYVCSDNQVKNVIFASIDDFMKGFERADSEVLAKLRNYKRRLIPGTEEYDLIYHRLY